MATAEGERASGNCLFGGVKDEHEGSESGREEMGEGGRVRRPPEEAHVTEAIGKRGLKRLRMGIV